jgi:putative SOS response-associated peptidase YedK
VCYDIQTGYERRINEGKHRGVPADQLNALIDEYNKRFDPTYPLPHVLHHVSAFSHPEVGVIHLKGNELVMEPMVWGLIPAWTKDLASAHRLWNQTANARSETMFDKPSFRAAARKRRGIIVIDSFYEHHHFLGKAYPFNVRYADESAMVVAVLWEEWTDKSTGELLKTFSMVTTEGNELMSVLHNSPKLDGPRMPVFLQGEAIAHWLNTPDADDAHLTLVPLCRPLADNELKAYSVKPLRGKGALGNVAEAHAAHSYPELEFDEELKETLAYANNRRP